MMRYLLLAGTALATIGLAHAQVTPPPACGTANGSGAFSIANGQIIGPNGQPWVAKGTAVLGSEMGNIAPQTLASQGYNSVNLAIGADGNGYQSAPSNVAIEAWVQQANSAGMTVMISDYVPGQPQARSGADLQASLAWYGSLAHDLANNPMVMWTTENEVSGNQAQVDQGIYNAIRGAGNNGLIFMEAQDGNAATTSGLDPGIYASMKNVGWNIHIYPWEFDTSQTNQAYYDNTVKNYVSTFQNFAHSADGVMPVFMGEGGNSTAGNGVAPDDSIVNGKFAVTQAIINTAGAAGGTAGYDMWLYDWHGASGAADQMINSNGSLTSFGAQVAAAPVLSPPCGQTFATLPPVSSPFMASPQTFNGNSPQATPNSNSGPYNLAPFADTACPTQTFTWQATVAGAATPGNGSFSVGGSTYTVDAGNGDVAAVDGSPINQGAYETAQLVQGSDGGIYGQSSAANNAGQWFLLSSDGANWQPLDGVPAAIGGESGQTVSSGPLNTQQTFTQALGYFETTLAPGGSFVLMPSGIQVGSVTDTASHVYGIDITKKTTTVYVDAQQANQVQTPAALLLPQSLVGTSVESARVFPNMNDALACVGGSGSQTAVQSAPQIAQGPSMTADQTALVTAPAIPPAILPTDPTSPPPAVMPVGSDLSGQLAAVQAQIAAAQAELAALQAGGAGQ